MKQTIDILMATYNGETYLREQIESILNQTYQDIRLIISDDCSKDKTREIITEYEKKDKRVKSYFQEKNLGYVKNRFEVYNVIPTGYESKPYSIKVLYLIAY